MDNQTIGLIGIVVLVILFFLKVPVGFSMLLVGFFGFAFLTSWKAALNLLGADLFLQFADYNLTAFPMFILAGSFAFASGMGDRIFAASHALLGRLPGNLAIASAIACAGFAAICGSSTATTAAVGKVAIPAMRRNRYDSSLATGVIAAAGALGPLIPPSVIFILYGLLTEVSIGKLFIAGILPGILLTVLLVATVIIICLRNPALAPASPPATRKEKIDGLIGVTETAILFGTVLGGLFLGWFSPTQGGAALGSTILILALVRRQITWPAFWEAVRDSLQISCMIIIIMAGGFLFNRFMAVSHLHILIGNWVSDTQLPAIVIMTIILTAYVILGFFMDMMGVTVLTIPIIFPAVVAMGFDPVWFGVMMVVVGGTAVITPPVGVNVYVIASVARDIPIGTIFRGIFPFLVAEIICIIILVIFPQIATWLPSFTTY
jgi:C4-dicarboxylate transporter DctM subunit